MADKVIHTFKANEKLKSDLHIEALFKSGRSFFAAPLKVHYLVAPCPPTLLAESNQPDTASTMLVFNAGLCKAGFSVSKKLMKRAVHRNRVKRLLREAYRLHKHKLIAAMANKQDSPLQLHLFFVYCDKQLPAFSLVEEKMKYGIRRLIKIVEGNA